MLNLFFDVLSIVVLFVLIFPIGYLLTELGVDEKTGQHRFLVKLPIYLTMGFSGMCVLLFVVSHFMLNLYVAFGSFLALLLIVLGYVVRKKRKNSGNVPSLQPQSIHSRFNFSSVSIVIVVTFALLILYFAQLAAKMEWAPAGDAETHGLIVGLFNYNQRYPTSWAPINSGVSFTSPLSYPMGFHIMGSLLSQVVHVYPGEAILLLACGIATLIPLVLFSITYTKTKSIFFALFSFLLAFISNVVVTDIPSASLLMGNLTNGTYPNLMGILILLGLFYVIICRDNFAGNPFKKLSFSLPFIVSAIALLLTYPLLLIFVVLYLAARFGIFIITNLNSLRKSFINQSIRAISIWLVSIISLLLVGFFLFTEISSRQFMLALKQSFWPSEFIALGSYFISSTQILIVIFSAFCLMFLLISLRRSLSLVLIYFCLFMPIILSMFYYLDENFLWFVGSNRTIICLAALSYVALPIALYDIYSHILAKKNFLNLLRGLKGMLIRITPIVLLLLAFTPTLFNYANAQISSWGIPRDDTYDASVWIVNHISPNALILNDRSFTGMFLPSFGAQNVINNLATYKEAYWECNQIFDNPGNYTLTKYLVTKYNISYLFVTSDSTYWDSVTGISTRQWNESSYVSFFDNNPYLSPVFRSGNTGVYKTSING